MQTTTAGLSRVAAESVAQPIVAVPSTTRASRRWRGFSVSAAVLASVLVLSASGCGFEVVDTGRGLAPELVSQDSASSTSVSAQPSPSSIKKAVSAQPSPVKPSGPNAKAHRSYYAGEVDITTGCPKGKIVIDQVHRTTVITEYCKEVIVTAPFSTVLAERVGTLKVESGASHSYFLIRELSTASLKAPFDHLYWDKGHPRVKITGFKTIARMNPVKEK